jgi:aminopeptidase-like protein
MEIYELIEKLFPICRSITGNGVRETLNIIKRIIPINVKEIASGTEINTWKIPKEWNINDAYILDKNKEKIIDFKKNNLHVSILFKIQRLYFYIIYCLYLSNQTENIFLVCVPYFY